MWKIKEELLKGYFTACKNTIAKLASEQGDKRKVKLIAKVGDPKVQAVLKRWILYVKE